MKIFLNINKISLQFLFDFHNLFLNFLSQYRLSGPQIPHKFLVSLWAKIVRFLKNRSPAKGSHKWETIWESTESVEHNVNGLRQTDIRIRLRDKSFRLWDPFEGEK